MLDWTTIILAGGQSRRMGVSKTLLDLGDKRMIEHMVGVAAQLTAQTVVVSRPQERPVLERLLTQRATVITDTPEFAGMGPLAGIHAGMLAFPAKWLLVLSNDLPNLERSYLLALQRFTVEHEGVYDAFIPIEGERLQPFAATYRNQARRIETLLGRGMRSWHGLYKQLQAYAIEEQVWKSWCRTDRPFFNMNSWEDYMEWQRGKQGLG